MTDSQYRQCAGGQPEVYGSSGVQESSALDIRDTDTTAVCSSLVPRSPRAPCFTPGSRVTLTICRMPDDLLNANRSQYLHTIVVIELFIGIGAAELLRLHLYEVASASQGCLHLHFLSLCIILGRTPYTSVPAVGSLCRRKKMKWFVLLHRCSSDRGPVGLHRITNNRAHLRDALALVIW